VSERVTMMGNRTGLLGLFDRIRFNEILRQGIGLLLVAVCAYFARAETGTVVIGLAMAVAGQIFRIYAAGYIHKNKQLASTGPYALVRHPLYLGNFLILVGFTIASANLYVTITVILFFLIWYPAAIAYEDSKLENIFEDEWRAWSKNIRAIIPGRFQISDFKAPGGETPPSRSRKGGLANSLDLLGCGIWLWVVSHAL
jgi:protein-S-isoprenylcysteine O-methyltransferase Ste14